MYTIANRPSERFELIQNLETDCGRNHRSSQKHTRIRDAPGFLCAHSLTHNVSRARITLDRGSRARARHNVGDFVVLARGRSSQRARDTSALPRRARSRRRERGADV